MPLFDATLEKAKQAVDAQLEKGIDVPIPKDMAGGYTHTQHKINYATMHKAGILFQLTGDEKYAIYIRDMLLEYAKMFPTLPRHPQTRSYARGKIFWQCLNDSNWLVYSSQAYDCIYSWLPKEQSDYLNRTLFRPYADFLSLETPQYFNRVHNHSTWGNVAVGMIGLVMDDDELVKVQSMFRNLTSELILSGINPLMIAGVMTASGIRMYKDTMVREEFLQMVEIVYEEAIGYENL